MRVMIETERLTLRPMTEADTDALLLIFTDPRVMAAILFVIMGVLYAILHKPICNWKGLS